MVYKFLNDDFRVKGNERLSSGLLPEENSSDASFIVQLRPNKYVQLPYIVQLVTQKKQASKHFFLKIPSVTCSCGRLSIPFLLNTAVC